MEKSGHTNSSEYGEISEPLLQSSEYKSPPYQNPQSIRWVKSLWLLLLNIFQFGCIITLLVRNGYLLRTELDMPYSPANEALSYMTDRLWTGDGSPYMGMPEEVDDNWRKLLEPVNIRATKEEMVRAEENLDGAVQLADGTADYVAVLAVYHELHCLNTLRMNIHADYYWPNGTAQDPYNIHHMSHCVDTLRKTIMCKADISVYSTYWIGDQAAFPSKDLRSEAERVCVNWDLIEGWARGRLLERNKFKVLAGPYEKVQPEEGVHETEGAHL